MKEGKGAEYVDVSALTLVFVSSGYFVSANCMRELLRAVLTQKPLRALMEAEEKHGALSEEAVLQQLREADANYERWGICRDVRQWGYHMPTPDELFQALFSREPIEWNRIGAFQDVTMRLVGEAMLAHSSGRINAASPSSPTFLQGELTRSAPTSLPEPPAGKTHHVCCSPHNAGAAALMREVAEQLKLRVIISETADELAGCSCLLVHLTSRTWTSGATSTAFASEVCRAMESGVSLLLCHEMQGLGGQALRHGCLFECFFSHPNGATPQELLAADIYSQIATPLKGGPWRPTSLVMVAQALAEAQLKAADADTHAEAGVDGERELPEVSLLRRLSEAAPAASREPTERRSSLSRLRSRAGSLLPVWNGTRSDAIDERVSGVVLRTLFTNDDGQATTAVTSPLDLHMAALTSDGRLDETLLPQERASSQASEC